MGKISVVVNTLNEAKNLPRALASVKNLADDIVVVDMKSDDGTAAIAKKEGARVYEHARTGYVEPARNFAISKAVGEWIFVLDADEEAPKTLVKKLKEISKKPTADYYRLPRKNFVFGKWLKHSRWWPDYNIRFFKKGSVSWNEVIHSVPMTQGKGADLPEKEELAIIHYHYDSIEQYLSRMHRYTEIQSRELIKKNHKFIWKDLITKPFGEFLSRFFVGEGYKDGVHGLALSGLQAFSEFLLYLKVWQSEKFLEQTITFEEVEKQSKESVGELKWWLAEISIRNKNFFSSLPERIVKKLVKKND